MTRADSERLLALLRRRTSARGIALAREGWLLDELKWLPQRLNSTLERLVEERAITLLSPLPFLAVKWPNHGQESAQIRPLGDSYKSSLSQSRLIKDSHSHREPEKDSALLRELLDALGETDPTTFRGALVAYSPEAIRLTLDRVRRMKRITKSRTALFRFLLPRVAKEADSKA